MIADIIKQVGLLLVAILFFALGILGILLPWSQTTRDFFSRLFLEGGVTLFIFGILFASIGGAILGFLITSLRQRRYYIKSGKDSISVDEDLIDTYLKTYIKERFPGHQVESRVHVREDHKLHIDLRLPQAPRERQKLLLNQVENELTDLLAGICGYTKTFYLTATFKD